MTSVYASLLTDDIRALMRRLIADGPMLDAEVDPKVRLALLRARFIKKRAMPSKNEWHFGALVPYVLITELGRTELARLDPANE